MHCNLKRQFSAFVIDNYINDKTNPYTTSDCKHL